MLVNTTQAQTKILVFFCTLLLLQVGCRTKIVEDTGFLYVNLLGMSFNPTQEKLIEIFTDRKAITKKYYEIGILKSNIERTDLIIKNAAAKYGAEAVIKDGLNYIIIRYSLDEKKEAQEWKSI